MTGSDDDDCKRFEDTAQRLEADLAQSEKELQYLAEIYLKHNQVQRAKDVCDALNRMRKTPRTKAETKAETNK
jgi:hypothetical protein